MPDAMSRHGDIDLEGAPQELAAREALRFCAVRQRNRGYDQELWNGVS